MPDDPRSRVFVDRNLPVPPPPGLMTLVQVIGDRGLGKSTQLEHWRSSAPGPYHYIVRNPYRSRWQKPPVANLVYGDEIDRMPSPRRLRWFQGLAFARATVVIGTHTDLGRQARLVGFDVLTHHLVGFDQPALHGFLERRLAEVAIGRDHIRFTRQQSAEIHERTGGRPRAVEVEAHRVLADMVMTSTSTEAAVS